MLLCFRVAYWKREHALKNEGKKMTDATDIADPTTATAQLLIIAGHATLTSAQLCQIAVHPNVDGAVLHAVVENPAHDAASDIAVLVNPFTLPEDVEAIAGRTTMSPALNLAVADFQAFAHNPDADANTLHEVVLAGSANDAVVSANATTSSADLVTIAARATSENILDSIMINPNHSSASDTAVLQNSNTVVADLIIIAGRTALITDLSLITMHPNRNIDSDAAVLNNPNTDQSDRITILTRQLASQQLAAQQAAAEQQAAQQLAAQQLAQLAAQQWAAQQLAAQQTAAQQLAAQAAANGITPAQEAYLQEVDAWNLQHGI